MTKAYMNWSGGKDSSLAVHKILLEKQFEIVYLLTSVNSYFDRKSTMLLEKNTAIRQLHCRILIVGFSIRIMQKSVYVGLQILR